jgi:hypothetical protein
MIRTRGLAYKLRVNSKRESYHQKPLLTNNLEIIGNEVSVKNFLKG